MNKPALSVEWYVGCATEEQRQRRKEIVLSSRSVLEVLKTYLEHRKNGLSVKEEDYNVASWAYLQAHRNGKTEELDRLIKFIGSVLDHE